MWAIMFRSKSLRQMQLINPPISIDSILLLKGCTMFAHAPSVENKITVAIRR